MCAEGRNKPFPGDGEGQRGFSVQPISDYGSCCGARHFAGQQTVLPAVSFRAAMLDRLRHGLENLARPAIPRDGHETGNTTHIY